MMISRWRRTHTTRREIYKRRVITGKNEKLNYFRCVKHVMILSRKTRNGRKTAAEYDRESAGQGDEQVDPWISLFLPTCSFNPVEFLPKSKPFKSVKLFVRYRTRVIARSVIVPPPHARYANRRTVVQNEHARIGVLGTKKITEYITPECTRKARVTLTSPPR